jgi:hypothetical protein
MWQKIRKGRTRVQIRLFFSDHDVPGFIRLCDVALQATPAPVILGQQIDALFWNQASDIHALCRAPAPIRLA